ncbi:MAG: patatin-like phospholipase family protein [Hyphomicrobiales bacterium]|nr:patatin-like phospholipase family protein [Hyphomicrobiales bacterium]
MSGDFAAVAFAGGGNRCYWQGGFWDAFAGLRPQRPDFVVGVSAGAFQACFSLIGAGKRVRERVFAACAETRTGIDWARLASGASPFLVGDMYRTLLADVFGPSECEALQRAPEILIQVAHPPPWMPAAIAALSSIAVYQIEKLVTGAAHSSAGRYVGLTPDWVSTHRAAGAPDIVEALMATASVPPFMPIGRVNGRAALDGGLVDNPPLEKLGDVEASGRRTLVLSTRSAKPLQSTGARTVVRPSQPVTIDKFSVTDADGLRRAFELGLRDGEDFARRLARG